VLKPKNEGPAAYVFPGDDPRLANQAELLRTIQRQGCEVHRATAPFTVTLKTKKAASTPSPSESPAASPSPSASPSPTATAAEPRTFPAGSYVVRMDQPYSRIADAILDHQYWAPNDPQQDVYDDTGWTMGELGNLQVVRVTDTRVLTAPMERINVEVKALGGINGSGSVYLINHNADNALVALRYRLKDVAVETAEEPFDAAGRKFNRGSFIIRKANADELRRAAADLEVLVYAVEAAPAVKTHPVKAPRIALMHTWLSTQDEGWWRLALDQLGVPYAYISTQDVAKEPELRRKYDVVIFGPVGTGASAIIKGLPMWGNPLPWKTTPLTPNIGKIDSTDDMRPGLGHTGLVNLQKFTTEGGLLIGVMDTAELAVNSGFTPGLSISQSDRLKAIGVVLRSKVVDAASPIAYGYGDSLPIYSFNGPLFNMSNLASGSGVRQPPPTRTTGRGSPDDPDVVQGRPAVEAPEIPTAEVWQALPLTDEQRRNGINIIPLAMRPRVVFRYADNKDLFVSGLLDGGDEIAQRAMVVDIPSGQGHIVLFSNNPMWRGQTRGSYFLVFNAILNFDNLGAGRKLDEK
ncbi:MAG: hypothetical protein M3539_05230, partial [Acidobacteriota bacterium]|nr:hypothetical protein [Acidobacteriota bacterium]